MSRLLPGAPRRDRNLTIRLTEEQYAAYVAAAEAVGARTLTAALTGALDQWAAEVTAKKGKRSKP